MYGSYREAVGSHADNYAALMGAVSGAQTNYLTDRASKSRYSPAVTQQLDELNEKRESDEQEVIGIVTVENLENVDDDGIEE